MKYPFNAALLLARLFSQAVLAQIKVVLVPLAGDQLPSIPHPIDSPFINGIGMQFKTLPAGEPGRTSTGTRAETEHTVTLTKAFGMQVTEVTNGQWNAVIVDSSVGGVNPSDSHTQTNELDSHQVEGVTWFDAVFFANQLSSDESCSVCYTFSG